MEYVHLPVLVPTPELPDAYRKGNLAWSAYKVRFNALMEERRIDEMG